MTDYEKLLEESERSVVMPPPREPGRCDGDVSCRECDRDGDARCGLEYGHEGDHVPFADVYEQGLRDMIGKLVAALREVMAEGTLEMERAVRAEAERDLVSARAALRERGSPPTSAPLAEHEDMARWKRLPVWTQQELEQWRRNEAHQRGLAEAALSDVEAMRAVCDAADGTKRMLDWMLVNDRCGIETMGAGTRAAVEGSAGRLRDALHALDARATPPPSHRCPGCNAEHRGEYGHCETCRARIATPSGGKGRE